MEQYGQNIPKDWPIEVRAGQIVIPQQHQGKTLREAILQRTFEGGALLQKMKGYYDKIMPDSKTTETIERLNEIVNQSNRESRKIMGSAKSKEHPTLLVATPDKEEPFWMHLRHQILTLHLEQAGARTERPHELDKTREQQEVWVRDPYVMAPNGTALFHADIDDARGNGTLHALIEEFKKRDIPCKQVTSHIEGGDILQHPQSGTVFIGITTDENGMNMKQVSEAKILARTMGMNLRTIPRTQSATYYHLDTMMSVLPDGSVMVMPEATNGRGMAAIHDVVNAKDVLEVHAPSDKRSLALNLITVNKHVFTPSLLPPMEKFLRERGFYPHESFYEAYDSGPHCQVNVLNARQQDGENDVASVTRQQLGTIAKLKWQMAESSDERQQVVPSKIEKTLETPRVL